MTHLYVLTLADPQAVLENAGGKGASLARLAQAGLPVADGFHVTTAAYKKFIADNDLQPRILEILQSVDASRSGTLESVSQAIGILFSQAQTPREVKEAIAEAYANLTGNALPVAVRSSATAEDLPDLSFAGQQETFLNVSGVEAVLAAVKRCWSSLWTGRAIAYRLQHDVDQNVVSLAVVVQKLVFADAAGVLFTAHPVTGRRDHAMITAAWGLGEAIVGGLVTPDMLIVDQTDGQILDREIADKQMMTVRMEQGTQDRPTPENLRQQPVLNDFQAVELTRMGVQIEALYGMPMDIEWALAEGKFSILQARPITALPETGVPPDIEWKLPDPKGVYMRSGVVDLMPRPLTPLFTSLGIPSLVSHVQSLSQRMVGGKPLFSKDYFTSINTYGYMNTRFPARTWGWIIFNMLPSYPRLLRKLVPLWRDELLPEYQAAVAGYANKVPEELSTTELWQDIQALVDIATYYIGGLMFATMGASAGADGLLTQAYNKLAKQEGDPDASTLLIGWDNIPVRAEKSLYSLAQWCRQQEDLASFVLETPSDKLGKQLADEQAPAQVDIHTWEAFKSSFDQHLKQYGYIVFQLDFAEPLPLDHPEPMIENIKMYLRGGGANPYERQHTSELKRIHTAETMLRRLKGLKRWAFRLALNYGQSLAAIREDALAEIGLAYPMLRQMLRELGKRFVDADVVDQPEDIYWLKKEEIDTCVADLENGRPQASLVDEVTQRKAFQQKMKQITPPPMIPYKKRVMGIKTDSFLAHSEEVQTSHTLKGIATSPGKVTAPACVLRGSEDFNQMRPGDVLVAGTTTPAWTPLFAMASAVVTDIGGPLSHGSIIAREYSIPAVMGTGVATQRIRSGQMITVDGCAGTVTLFKSEA